MVRFIIALIMSFTFATPAVAAVKWNNPGSGKAGSDPKSYWVKAKKAKSCNGPEFDYLTDKISVKKITIDPSVYEGITSPLGLNSSKKCKFNFASEIVPKPLIDAKISSKYGGFDNERFEGIYDFINTNIGLNRLQPMGPAQQRLKEFLLTWSAADALSKNIRFKLMKEFRLDFHIQSMIPPLIIAYSDVSDHLSNAEKIQIGTWINRLVEQSQQSDFYSRQDNKAYLRHLIALLWGIVIQNEELIAQAKAGYEHAILDMRPDGTFPKEVSRGGTGIKYQNRAINVLVTMAGYATLIGENWIEYEVNGRSIKNAVDWIDKASQDPSMNKIYARECVGGSDGTIENPIMNYLDTLRTGSSDIAWVEIYTGLTGDKPAFLSQKMRDYKGLWSLSYGPQACVVMK